jgi:hypothetical protein
MTTGLLTDAAERFVLGPRNGFTPTTEPVSDTVVTPFGLTLRTIPTRRDSVLVRTANGVTMATQSVSELSTDGSDDGDTRYDVIDE